MDGRIESVLDVAFPDRAVEAVQSPGPSWNEKNRTVRVEFADGQSVYLKVAADGDGSRIARERAVVDYVGANTEVPVPTVLASETDGAESASETGESLPYLATAPVDGRSLLAPWSDADREERSALARQVGRALASVHGLRFADHGHVVGGGADGLQLETGTWTDVLLDEIGDMRDIAPSERFDHHFDEVRAAVEASRSVLDDAPAALVHGDPAKPNCFVTETGVGMLDWELAHVGDPARDLHRARDQQLAPVRGDAPDDLVGALYDGYRERAGGLPAGFEDRRPVYEAVRFLGTSGFFEKLADFADESLAEFADWVEAEMDRRLDAI